MRKLQLLIGVLLAVAGVVGVIVLGRMSQPTTYQVVIATTEIPAYTPISAGDVGVDTQSVSAAVAKRYVLADEWEEMLAAGPVVAIDHLRPGQPILREEVAAGTDAQGVTRLAAALNDPHKVVLSVPIDPEAVPGVVPGDAVALFFSGGRVAATSLVTEEVEVIGEPRGSTPLTRTTPIWRTGEEDKVVTVTVELEMPLSKRIATGVVYRLNRERKANPNYGAPGMENEPRYIEGAVKSLDVVVADDEAEWVVFALAHGQVQVGVLPAMLATEAEEAQVSPTAGVTWSDFEARFFQEREGGDNGRQ